MKKRILSLLMVFCLIATVVPVPVRADSGSTPSGEAPAAPLAVSDAGEAYAGPSAISDAGEAYAGPPAIPDAGDVWDGSVVMPTVLVPVDGVPYYMITKSAELAYVAQKGGAWLSYNYLLGNDLILNNAELQWDDGGKLTAPASPHRWTPVGSGTAPFTGKFDGGGHTVSGLYVDGSSDYAGLFGYCSDTVMNLKVVNAFVKGARYVGGVVGYGGSCTGCAFSGAVFGTDCVGGIAGYGSAEGCVNYGAVNGGTNVGGVVGYGSLDGFDGGYLYATSGDMSETKTGEYYYWDFIAILNGERTGLTVKTKYGGVIETARAALGNFDGGKGNALFKVMFDKEGYVTNLTPVSLADADDTVYNNYDKSVQNSFSAADVVYNTYTNVTAGNPDTLFVRDGGRTLWNGYNGANGGRNDAFGTYVSGSDIGLTLAPDAPVFVVQRYAETNTGALSTKVEQVASLEAALGLLGNPLKNGEQEAKRASVGFRGFVAAGLNKNATAKWVVIKSLTTVNSPAQVNLRTENITQVSYNNAGADGPAENIPIDMAFSLTPISTSVEDNVDWDLLFWSDTSVEFEVYEITPSANGSITNGADAVAIRPLDGSGEFTTGSNGHYSVPIIAENVEGKDPDATADNYRGYLGQSYFSMFYGVSGTFPSVTGRGNRLAAGKAANEGVNPRGVLERNVPKYYGVHFTSIDNVPEASGRGKTWAATVNFRVSVVTSNSANLNTLSKDITNDTITAFEGDASFGGSVIHSPRPFSLRAAFAASEAPEFDPDYPSFIPSDTSVDMRLRLDSRAGTVHYVIAPASTFVLNRADGFYTKQYSPTITTKAFNGPENPAGEDLQFHSEIMDSVSSEYERYYAEINGHHADVPSGGRDLTVPAYDRDTQTFDNDTLTSKFELTDPANNGIYGSRNYGDRTKKGSVALDSGETTVTVDGLESETVYFVYLVTQGAGQLYSERAQLFQFSTEKLNRPRMTVMNMTSYANVAIARDSINATVEGNLLRADTLQSLPYFTGKFCDADTSYSYMKPERVEEYSALGTDTSGKSYQDYTLWETLLAPYGNGTMFDYFASEATKNAVANLIRRQDPNGSGEVRQRNINAGATWDFNDFEMDPGFVYIFFAMAYAQDVANASGDSISFGAAYPVQLIDSSKPTIISATGSIAVDYKDGAAAQNPVLSGEFYLTFARPLYLYNTSGGGLPTSTPLTSEMVATGFIQPSSNWFTASSADSGAVRTIKIELNGSVPNESSFMVNMQLCTEFTAPRTSQLQIRLRYDPVIDRVYVEAVGSDAKEWFPEDGYGMLQPSLVTRPDPAGFVLNPSALNLEPGGVGVVTATLIPSNAEGKVEFAWDGSSAGSIEALSNTTAQVTAKAPVSEAVTGTLAATLCYANGEPVPGVPAQNVTVTVSPQIVGFVSPSPNHITFDASYGSKLVTLTVNSTTDLNPEDKAISESYTISNGGESRIVVERTDNALDDSVNVSISLAADYTPALVETYYITFYPENTALIASGTVMVTVYPGTATAAAASVYSDSAAADSSVTKSVNRGAVTGEENVGGVVGSGSAMNCYNTAAVTGGNNVGGVVGYGERGSVNCYNIGAVSSTSEGLVGAIAGGMSNAAAFAGCYYLEPGAAGLYGCGGVSSDPAGFHARPSGDLKVQDTFDGWDFKEIWAIDSDRNEGYPYLGIEDDLSATPNIVNGAEIVGNVSDTNGSAVEGATVELISDDGAATERTTTDKEGYYTFPYAEVGRYTIRATDGNGNTGSETVSVKRMNLFKVYVTGQTDIILKTGYTVSGTVTPASGATVTLTSAAGRTVASVKVSGGSYELKNIPNGSYLIKAENGTGSVSKELRVYNAKVEIDLVIPATAAAISGTVKTENTDGSQSPRAYAQVSLYNSQGVLTAQTRSDENGGFAFAGVPLDSYAIVAEADEMRTDSKGSTRSCTLAGYAYVVAEKAQSYDNITVVLHEQTKAEASFSGKVTANGQTQDSTVTVTDASGNQVVSMTTGNNGKYTFKNLSDGLYFVTAVTSSNGTGSTIVVIQNGKVYGDTDIRVYKSDKVSAREGEEGRTLLSIAVEDAASHSAEIAAEKDFYDSLTDRERQQLSADYQDKLTELAEASADYSCKVVDAQGNISSSVTLQNGGTLITADEIAEQREVRLVLTVERTSEPGTSSGGAGEDSDYLRQTLEDAAGDKELAAYYDVSLTKNGQSISNIAKQTDTAGKLRITMDIPSEYRGHVNYSIIHVHNSEPTVLADLDDNPNTVTFEMDKFSTCALAYSDVTLAQQGADDPPANPPAGGGSTGGSTGGGSGSSGGGWWSDSGSWSGGGSSGGGSGGSSSSGSSSTGGTTTTNKGGNKTTTTTNKDGSKTAVTTTADGSVGTVVTDAKGNIVSAQASVSAQAASDAAASGRPVSLPIEVRTASSASSAATVGVTLPAGSGRVVVEVPVKNLTSSTVAMIVRANGAEEIVKTSVNSKNGVVLTLDGSATLKIVDNARSFLDVSGGQWFADTVAWASSHEVMNGVSPRQFGPDAPMNRAMLAQLLFNLDNARGSGVTGAFADVSAGDWYAESVTWAYESGIMEGYGGSRFAPEDPITREQMATILYRYARYKGYDVTARANLSNYTDGSKVSSWSSDAMSWAVGQGLITGISSRIAYLDPLSNSSRAHMATLLMRFCAGVVNGI